MRGEKKTVAKQLRIGQDNRYRYIYSGEKVMADNFLKIRLSWAIFPLKCGAVAQWRGDANLAKKNAAVVRWRNDFKGGAHCGGAN